MAADALFAVGAERETLDPLQGEARASEGTRRLVTQSIRSVLRLNLLSCPCSWHFLPLSHLHSDSCRSPTAAGVMAQLLVLTSRLHATLPPPRNCRHHHQHSLPYSFTEHWAGQTYNKALLKVLYPMPEARVTGPASSEAKQLVRLNQKDDSVLEAC